MVSGKKLHMDTKLVSGKKLHMDTEMCNWEKYPTGTKVEKKYLSYNSREMTAIELDIK